MLILIALGLIIALAAVITVLYYRLTKAREALFAARRDRAKLGARLEAARTAAQNAEARCTGLMHQVNTSLANTGQALNVARHIEVIGQQMTQLLELVGYEDGAHAAADTAQLDMPYGPREIPGPVSVPAHLHVDHTQPLPITHPGQRQARRSA